MKIANNDIRIKAKESGIALWRIGDALGFADTTFCRKLRHELPQETKNQIFRIIDELKEAK